MSEWVEILHAPVEHDLEPFRHFLKSRGIDSYVFEHAGNQCLCVPAETDRGLLDEAVLVWSEGDVSPSALAGPFASDDDVIPGTVFAQWYRFPLTLLLCALSGLVFCAIATAWGQSLGGLQWLVWLSFQTLTVEGDQLSLSASLPPFGEAWRYWTPMFLHFSFFHILFNGLMLLELGRRIEMLQGAQRLLFLVMACGLVSNLSQFYAAADGLFGGMSGVIYALVGYCWLYQRLQPTTVFNTPPGLMTMALVWLLLCFSGLVTMVGLGRFANAAHVGGLLAGLALAWLLSVLDRKLP